MGECPSGKYFDYSTSTCKDCGSNCLRCFDGESCDLCTADSSMTSSKDCYFECPPGTYFEQTVDGTFCFDCDSSCKTCTGPDEDQCTSCMTESLYSQEIFESQEADLLDFITSTDPEGVCRICPSGMEDYYGFCRNCSDNCVTCNSGYCT